MQLFGRREDVVELSPDWAGERSPDGRPRVSDDVLSALRQATTEQAWSVLRAHGYERQFAGEWQQTNPGKVIVGRAVTAQFLPHRPDLDQVVIKTGAQHGHLEADRQNSWVIQRLVAGDVLVVDIFGKVLEGTVVGDNLGTAVAVRTGVGAVIDGGVRDLQGLAQLRDINIFMRGVHPTPIRDVTLVGVNIPVRVGQVTVLPGDVVLGTPTGVIFIPPHLATAVVEASREIQVRDRFGKLRLSEGVYTSAQIDLPQWPAEVEADFTNWRRAFNERVCDETTGEAG
jgi:4-hydroxy-4-methyl-2-oxoglutarate aldolase